jgi:hypothetical protein
MEGDDAAIERQLTLVILQDWSVRVPGRLTINYVLDGTPFINQTNDAWSHWSTEDVRSNQEDLMEALYDGIGGSRLAFPVERRSDILPGGGDSTRQ